MSGRKHHYGKIPGWTQLDVPLGRIEAGDTSAAGLDKLPFHILRHTCGTTMAAANVNARAIAGWLGHANATFTLNTYVHTTGDIEQHAAESIAQAPRKVGK